MPDFARFDRRHYPTVSVREGYRAWTPSYEDTVEDEWIALKPRWEEQRDWPINFALVWRASN